MGDRYSEDPKLISPLVVSHLIPVVGGVYEYFKFKESHPEMSKIFKFGTFGVPVGVLVDQALSLGSLGGYWSSTLVLLGVAFVIKKVFLKQNKYADIIWISYTALPGFVYAYYFKYSDKHGVRYLIYHSTLRTIAYAVMIGLLLGVVLIMFSGLFMGSMPIY